MGALELPTRVARSHEPQARIGLPELARLLRVQISPCAGDGSGRYTLMRLGAGETLFRAGDRLRSVYAVRSGFLKTSIIRSGAEQVLGFPMRGDLVGIEGAADGVHVADAVALDDGEVAIIPRAELDADAGQSGTLAGELWRLAGRELARRAELVALLGSCGAEPRVAGFLLSLADRYAQLGYSPRWFRLRMTRADIGNLLGLSHETVTRVLTRFNAIGLIRVRLKDLEICAPAALRTLAEGGDAAPLAARGRRRFRRNLDGRTDGRKTAAARSPQPQGAPEALAS